MTKTIKMDSSGRITIPVELREELGWKEGNLEISKYVDRIIIVRGPIRNKGVGYSGRTENR